MHMSVIPQLMDAYVCDSTTIGCICETRFVQYMCDYTSGACPCIQIYTLHILHVNYKPNLIIIYTHTTLMLHEVIHCVTSWFLANQFEKSNIIFDHETLNHCHFHWFMFPYEDPWVIWALQYINKYEFG